MDAVSSSVAVEGDLQGGAVGSRVVLIAVILLSNLAIHALKIRLNNKLLLLSIKCMLNYWLLV